MAGAAFCLGLKSSTAWTAGARKTCTAMETMIPNASFLLTVSEGREGGSNGTANSWSGEYAAKSVIRLRDHGAAACRCWSDALNTTLVVPGTGLARIEKSGPVESQFSCAAVRARPGTRLASFERSIWRQALLFQDGP